LRGPVGPYKENRRGDVAKVQSLLHDVGYFDANETDGPTGIYAKALMDEPIRKFQEDNGLAVDGFLEPDGETIGQLETLLSEHTWQNPFHPVRTDKTPIDPEIDGIANDLSGNEVQVAQAPSRKPSPLDLILKAPVIIEQLEQWRKKTAEDLKKRQPLPDAGAVPPSPAQPPIPPSEMQTPGFPATPPFDPNEEIRDKKPIEPIVIHGTRFPITADSKPQIYIFPDLSDEIEQILKLEVRRERPETKRLNDAVRDVIPAQHPGSKHVGGAHDIETGGEKREHRTPGPGKLHGTDGRRGSIFADVTVELPSKKLVHVQTVDIDPKTGKVTEREWETSLRLFRRTGQDVILIPKTWQIDRLKPRD
jgi:hypothetical protein